MTLLMWLEQVGHAKHEVELPVIWYSLFLIIATGTFGWRYVILHGYTEIIKNQYFFLGCIELKIISFCIDCDMYLPCMLLM